MVTIQDIVYEENRGKRVRLIQQFGDQENWVFKQDDADAIVNFLLHSLLAAYYTVCEELYQSKNG